MDIYTPQKHPKEAVIIIVSIALLGILLGLFVHMFFLIVALLFWIQYTLVLSYKQFKNPKPSKHKGPTGVLLNPQIRFLIFEFIAIIGLWSTFKLNTPVIGAAALLIWMGFSINFFFYYKDFKKG